MKITSTSINALILTVNFIHCILKRGVTTTSFQDTINANGCAEPGTLPQLDN